jgi:hypothetical protein
MASVAAALHDLDSALQEEPYTCGHLVNETDEE